MKNLTLITTALLLFCLKSNAQFLGGFFSQQSDKQKLMVTQIAEYDVYLHALKTGYTITETGLNTANELKCGTFNLHTAYFNSLEQVNPVVQSNPKGKAIVTLAQQIATRFTTEIYWENQQKVMSAEELAYLQKVHTNLTAKCQLDLSDLNDVLTPGKLKLTDQQRIDRLDKLYASMQDKYAFACSFTGKSHSVALGRQHNKTSNDQLKKLYGIQ